MQSLLATLSALGVKLEVADGKLVVHAPAGVLTRQLQESLGRHKEALIESLQAARTAGRHEELPRIVVDPERRHEPFPLNDVQHAYWIGRSGHVELGEVPSHVYFEFECGPLDGPRLAAAFRRVVALHGMLRAVIDVNGRQRILAAVPDYEVAVSDLRAASPEQRAAELERVRAELSQQVFSCERWPLFDVRLILLDADRSRLCVSWEFLVIDAWSLLLIFEQWYGFYADPAFQVPVPTLSFRDYVLAEAGLKQLPAYRAAREYWWRRLDELPAAPLLPSTAKLEKGRRHEFRRRRCRIPARQWEEIKARSRRAGLTLSSTLLAAFAELLDRWVRSPHYCLNLTLFNRLPMHEEVGAIVGDFTNLLVLEVDGRAGGGFVARALRLQERFLEDFEHRQVSAVEVLRELAKRRGWQQAAILPVVFTSTLMMDGKRSADAAGWERFGALGYGISQTPQVTLDYQIFEVGGDLVVNWDAVDEAFLPGVLDDMFATHLAVLEALATQPEAWQREGLAELPAAQLARRAAANATAAAVAVECLHEGFVARALQAPASVALVHGGGEMRYGELLAAAVEVAGRLLARGVRPNELVAVVMVKGWEQIVAVLGVLIAGGAYLPLDARWPVLRRHQLLQQGEARIALTTPALDASLEWPAGVERLVVAAGTPAGRACPAAPPPRRQTPGDLAYVIFTSGSTGVPKGVMIDHRAAVNTVFHMNRLFAVEAGDRVLAVSDLTFDLSVYDIFGLLAAGGAIVLPDAELSRDPAHWTEQIERLGVTIWNSAPPLLGMLVDALDEAPARDLARLRLVLLSGDWIPVQLPGRIRRLVPEARVISLGGATEGAIWSIYYPIEAVEPGWDSIPYGRALPNQHMYVLDRNLRPCPDGVIGDIYIGGMGVALGYWRDAERTGRQFVVHPASGERLYFTGDLGRMRSDGNIEFLGREDSQVKLRGYRVELGEIAACLQSHPQVKEAVVQRVQSEGRESLAAYLVAGGGESGSLFAPVTVPAAQLQEVARRVAAAGTSAAETADRDGLRAFRALWDGIEAASLQAMREALQALGLAGAADAEAVLAGLVQEGRVKPLYVRLVRRWRRMLAGHGGLAADRPPAGDQIAALERSFGEDGRLRGFLEHAAGCLRNHLALFAGTMSPLELLFPEGSWQRAESLYEKSPILAHHNRVLAAAVRALVRTWDGDRRIRVLELGAGTGGSAAWVLPELPAERTEYWYTDLSPYFLDAARAKFAAYPFVRYGLCHVDRSLQSQGHPAHAYDLVVAANVLHNAADVHAVLANVRQLLQPGGHLVMLEGTRPTPWQWATVAFLEAVEEYADERLAADVPVLGAGDWARALARGGFAHVHVFPPPGQEDERGELAELLDAMPQHVIVAQGPATVRRFRTEELAGYLRERLPAYMVPQSFVLLESLPLSANGKIDLAALPRGGAAPAAEERRIVMPRSATEEKLAAIWKDVLHVEQLGITDNFFEVGGDSLLMTAVLRRINQWQQPPLTIANLFAFPTIKSLAEFLRPAPGAGRGQAAPALAAATGALPAAGRDIAVIGMAARFPDAANIDELWRNLAAGRCAVRHFSDAELLAAGVSAEELAAPGYVKAGVVLPGIDLFDAPFFGFTPREAELLDPQQRFLLECAVEALDAAGYPGEEHAGRIGVFVGKGTSRYLLDHILQHPEIVEQLGLMTILNLNEKDYAATLLSYKLNLTGPSLNVNTACSTALVAVHEACKSLLDGECEVALAGGVSFVTTLERAGYLYQPGLIMSPDGYCRAFSEDANGCVFGNGVGLLVLKPLAAARRDRDTIHAVIKGSAINNDGALKAGFSAPSVRGQAEVIGRALARAGVEPESLGLLEAHGTGTNLGDPIEFAALRQVFGGAREGARCVLGSVKTNLGHLDSAAGAAGLIKAIEALKHGEIPPTLHARVPSRRIDFADSPFYLNTEPQPWPAGAQPRRAGVSSFGVGGTNAHVIVEEAPAVMAPDLAPGPQLFALSAKTRGALDRMVGLLGDELGRRPDLAPGDVAFTLQVGRKAHRHRTYVVRSTLAAVRRDLAAGGRLRVVAHDEGQSVAVAFLFPGQGTQARGLTHELYETQAAFRSALDECAELVQLYTGGDLRDVLYGGGGAGLDIDQTATSQPLLFAVGYALARFWESLGVVPAAMLGHSLGEYVAACLAGVFTLEEALSLVVARGQLLQSLPPGRMLAVRCGEAELQGLLAGLPCSVAAVNGPQQCVAAGPTAGIEALQARLAAADIDGHLLRTSHAFHCAMVEPILATFEECVAAVARRRPSIPFLSNVTGTWIADGEAMSAAYWARHLRAPVRFGDGVAELAKIGGGGLVLVEAGLGHILSRLARRAGAVPDRVVATLGMGDRAEGERAAVLDSVGRLWALGAEIDWARLHEARQPRRVPLPSYSFDRKRYWIERRRGGLGGSRGSAEEPAADQALAAATPAAAPAERPPEGGPPSTEIEARLLAIWRRYLGIDGIGLRDDFFELGGDSLLATRVHAQIKRDFDVELPAGKMYDFATVRRVGLFIAASQDRQIIDNLAEEELEELLAVMET